MTTFILIIAGLNAALGCVNAIGYAQTGEPAYGVVAISNFMVAAALLVAL